MSIALLISSLFIGLASSLHCVGMCGPLVMSIPVQHLSENKKTIGIILYQIGRICTYALLGIIVGLVGWRMSAAGFQQVLSIVLGVLILLMLSGTFFLHKLHNDNWMNKKVAQLMFWAINRQTLSGMLLMGFANGLLPCGMVYIALTGAMATGTIHGAALFMLFFGIGTLPTLLALAFLGVKINWQARRQMQKAVPYIVAVTGILLIIRGLNLNIPYLSPFLSQRSIDTVSCH
ncbi:MAG: sulfite exporter TauE/SafE family protein [Chitinophagaceae bacterium]|nr:sulfite exporter TauE/SafE family protein [Chitinophagaceae bacterium]